jgi:uncharacterized membrane protein (DUF106 family)
MDNFAKMLGISNNGLFAIVVIISIGILAFIIYNYYESIALKKRREIEERQRIIEHEAKRKAALEKEKQEALMKKVKEEQSKLGRFTR